MAQCTRIESRGLEIHPVDGEKVGMLTETTTGTVADDNVWRHVRDGWGSTSTCRGSSSLVDLVHHPPTTPL